jgi:hypothetical protein
VEMEYVNLVKFVVHVQTVVIYLVGARIQQQLQDTRTVIQIMVYLGGNVHGRMLRHLYIHVKRVNH